MLERLLEKKMLFDIQLAFIICGNYIRLVETLSKFLDIKKMSFI